jgi:hypothetical protein
MTLPKAYALIFGGILTLVVGGLLTHLLLGLGAEHYANLVFRTACLAFVLLFLSGTAYWAGAKGWNPAVGVMLGLFCSLFGLVILMLLPDKSVHSEDKTMDEPNESSIKDSYISQASKPKQKSNEDPWGDK